MHVISLFIVLPYLKPFSIFSFILIFHHGEVGLIAALGDVVIFYSFEDCATWFVGVGAVGEAAVFREAEYLGKVTSEFLGFHVESAKAFDARRINQPPAPYRNHFTKGCRVLPEVVSVGDFGGTKVGMGNEAVDECGFTHPTVATKKRHLPFEQGSQLFDTFRRFVCKYSRSSRKVAPSSAGSGGRRHQGGRSC